VKKEREEEFHYKLRGGEEEEEEKDDIIGLMRYMLYTNFFQTKSLSRKPRAIYRTFSLSLSLSPN